MSIGQGIAVTPLQMLRAICAIANGGELLQPYIIDKIVMPDGRVLRQGQKKVVRRVMSEEVAAQMRGMMEQVDLTVCQYLHLRHLSRRRHCRINSGIIPYMLLK